VDWISPSTFRKVIEVNLFGVVSVTQAFLPLLKHTAQARIVNLSSVAGFLPAPMMAAYDASKHGVEGCVPLSVSLSILLRPCLYTCL
jgi:NAD(P)-dependent dehydrogenase (short-subunit alcohol dehydrogenase family)